MLTARNHALVDRAQDTRALRPREARYDIVTTALSHTLRQRNIVRVARDRGAERCAVSRRHQIAVHSVPHVLTKTANVCRNNRQSRRHRFEDDVRRVVEFGGQDEKICGPVPLRHRLVWHTSGEDDLIREPERRDAIIESRPQWTVTDYQ